MKKIVFIVSILAVAGLGFAKMVNWIVARVDSYAITSYDVKQMVEFKKVGGEQQATEKDALEDLFLSYSVLSLAKQNPSMQGQEREVDHIITSITNITNAEDAAAQFRLKLYQDYPEQFKLQIERNQMLRALMFYEPDLKEKANEDANPEALKAYYEKNKTKFTSAPELDLLVFAVEQPNNMSLDELVVLEDNIAKVGEYLKKTDDPQKVFSKFPSVKFTSYSGRTETKSIFDIIKAGMPEAVVSIALRPSLNLGGNNVIKINKGSVVSLPVAVPIPETKKLTYLIIKVIDRKEGGIQTYDKVKTEVEYRYKEERTIDLVRDFVVSKIKKGEIVLDMIDKNYQGVYDAFTRR